MRGIAGIVVVAGVLAGCFETPQEVLDDIVCQKVVDCFGGLVDQDECLQFLAPVSSECFDFTTTNAQDCALIEDSLETGGVCRPEMPDPGPE